MSLSPPGWIERLRHRARMSIRSAREQRPTAERLLRMRRYGLPQEARVPTQRPASGGHGARVQVAGVGFDPVTEQQAVDAVLTGLSDGHGGHVLTPNIDILRQLQQPRLSHLAHADLVLADGFPVVLASRLQGRPLPARVTGSSLIRSLARAALADDRRVFLVGGSSVATGKAAIDNLLAELPATRREQLGHHCPPMGFEDDPRRGEELRRSIRDHDADIVFIGLGFPKQDLLVDELRREFPHAWFVGCGAAIAMLAGEVSRAPRWMQRYGLEWAYRLAMEPRRLFRRYIIEDIPFALSLLARCRRRPL